MCQFSGIGTSMVAQRYHIAKNGSTSLEHRRDYGITSVPVRYTLRPHRRAADPLWGDTGALPKLTKPYRSTAVVLPL